MPGLDWNKFGVKGASKRDSFEELCLHMFCRRHRLSEGVSGDYNQAGLETAPVNVNGKVYGFQSKHFDNAVDYAQISKSITTALKKHGKDLDEICIYINLNAKPNSSESGKDIVALAAGYGVKIKWFTRSNFEVSLTKPQNLDLAQFYFGYGAEFKFLRDNADYRKTTLVKSKQFLKLHLLDSENKQVHKIEKEILDSRQKLFLISGDPASGKSTLTHQLFVEYAGLNEGSQLKMVDKIIAAGAIPQIINLKLCVTESLENIIRARQNDFSIRGTQLKIIYLLDGLDELNEERADAALMQMMELSQKSNTHKIIVTCRTGNFNRLQFKSYFKDSIDYKVGQLNANDIDRYFAARNVKAKIAQYLLLKASNPKLIDSVTDVLGLLLLWDSIEYLDKNSTILDLYELKVKKVLYDPAHYKDLPSLNLPNPKDEAILKLNEQISYLFHERFQFLLPITELQVMVMELYPKADYNSINAIINYIAALFFDTTSPDPSEHYYIYKHRRYQEYFFVKLLQKKYAENPMVLREVSILSNQELFQTFFIKGLRNIYREQNNIIGSLDLSLLDVYLGNHTGWGADSPYYLDSDEFIPTLVNQEDMTFNLLFEDENLDIKAKVFIDTRRLKNKFEAWDGDRTNIHLEDHLISAWESGVSRLMKLYVSFWEAGRTEVAKDIINNIREVQALYDKYKFLNAIRPERKLHIHNPYSASFHAWLYYRLNVIEDSPDKVFDEEIMPNIPASAEVENSLNDRSDTLKDYLKIMLDSHPTQLAEVFDKFTPAIKIELLKMLANIDRLKILVETKEIHDKILLFVSSYDSKINKNNYFILFYKKYFSIQLTEGEQEFLRRERNEIAQERDIEWEANNLFVNFATIAYALDEYTFEKQLELKPSSYYHGNAYSERVVIAMLYNSYISLLRGEVEFEYIYRQYAKYCEMNGDTRFKAQALQYTVAKLWTLIYGHSITDSSVKKLLAKRLVNELRILKYPFYLNLNRYFPALFAEITDEGDVEIFENELQNWDDDFQTKVDRYLQISLMYRTLNPKKASELFVKAMVDGTLRHGWRKDPIIHYDLVYSLGLVLKKQWLRGAEADKIIKEVYELVIRAYEISDGSGTNRGPYRFIEVIAKYDSDIAATYKDEYVKYQGKSNISNAIFTPIILSKVRAGLAIEQIEAHFDEFYVSYDYEGAPRSDYYEQMFVVYLAIARSQLYPNEDRKAALGKANGLIVQMEKEDVRYYLSDTDFASEKKEFVKLCKEFDIRPEIDTPKKSGSYGHSYSAAKEHAFQLELSQAKSLRKIKGAYKKLDNYKNGIYLKEDLSWQILITKTIELSEDISPFVDYLKSLNFPHSDYYSTNSEYVHHGVAHALSSPAHKQQMLDYLYNNGGHGGFHNMIKVYIQLNDRKTALGLLDRYIQLCKLLTT